MKKALAGQENADADGMAVGTELLNGQFLIQARLQGGGFAMTYIARDSLARQVVVKECFPAEICIRRDGLVQPLIPDLKKQFTAIKTQFVREARQLAKLVHPNIVAVHQVFEENNTAYMALDQIAGADLFTVADEQQHRITNAFLLSVLDQCLTALEFIHKNSLLHRDISPDNIMIDDRNHITLIDFGAAHEHSNKANSSIFAVKDGYSPYEFYIPKGKHEFSSDLYSLGATFHYLITGHAPPDSYTRLRAITSGKKDPYTPLASGDWPFDYNLLATVDHALKMRQKSRLTSTAAWRKELASLPKKRPAPSKLPVFDPNLESEISRLVNVTNEQLERVHGTIDGPRRKRSRSENRPKKSAQPTPKLVDIFGNPIDDIEAWQEEQEIELRYKRSVQKALAAADGSPRPGRFLPDKHLISDLIWRCFRKVRPENLRQTRF